MKCKDNKKKHYSCCNCEKILETDLTRIYLTGLDVFGKNLLVVAVKRDIRDKGDWVNDCISEDIRVSIRKLLGSEVDFDKVSCGEAAGCLITCVVNNGAIKKYLFVMLLYETDVKIVTHECMEYVYELQRVYKLRLTMHLMIYIVSHLVSMVYKLISQR